MTEYNIVYLLCHILRTYAIFKFMALFFDRTETNRVKETISYIIYYAVTAIIYITLNIPTVTTLVNMFALFVITMNYNAKSRKRLLAVLYTYTILVILELIVFWGIQYIDLTKNLPRNIVRITMQIVIAIFTYITVLIISNFKEIKNHGEVSLVKWIATITIPIITVLIGLMPVILQIDVEFSLLLIIIAAMFFVNIIVFYLYDELSKSAQEKLEKELVTKQNMAYEKQLDIIYQSQKNISLFRHDMKNHFNILKQFIYDENNQEALKYIDTVFDTINIQFEYCKSGNYAIDSIVNLKLSQAKQQGIDVNLQVKVPETLDIESFDLNVILGNLIDNAINGAKKATCKEINLKIYYDCEVLIIKVINSFNGVIKMRGAKFVSTQIGKNHGLGLTSTERAIDKYNGEIKFKYDKKTFAVKVLIFDTAKGIEIKNS